MTPRVLVLVGQPGVGKSALAQAIATHRMAMGRPVFVMHVDLLRHTLRLAGFRALEGQVWDGDPVDQFKIIDPYLHQHADKARRDGYDLVIEGNLAIGFEAAERYIQLQCDEAVRRDRIAHMSQAEIDAVASLNPARMDDILEEHAVDYREVLTTEADLGDLVLGVESTWSPPLI